MGARRKAREVALQTLYAREITGYPVREVLADQLVRDEYDEEVSSFVERLVLRVEEEREGLDRIIEEWATNWDLERIALIDKLILRMGLTELLHFIDVPAKVCINESIEMTKKYSSAEAKRFVNGILDAVYKEREQVREGSTS
ncbi:MAG: transcription antitermination factor NusB [bacterium]